MMQSLRAVSPRLMIPTAIKFWQASKTFEFHSTKLKLKKDNRADQLITTSCHSSNTTTNTNITYLLAGFS